MSTRQNLKQNKTIMIIDDTPGNLYLLEGMLHKHGYEVIAFTRGDMALQNAAKYPPDLILLDIMMPEINGFEVCRQLKADEKTKDIPVIFISALNDLKSKIDAFTHGGMDYVTKPFQEEEVIARVATHLNLNRMRKELEKQNMMLDENLRWAGEMQKALLRPKLHNTEGAEFTVTYQPVPGLHCGGDYYDVINLPGNRFLILLGDVAGHGVKAAFVTGILKAVIYSEYVWKIDKLVFSPGDFLSWLNERMKYELPPESALFITFLAGVINCRNMTFTFANAGHNYPFIISSKGIKELPLNGQVIGISKSLTYPEKIEQLNRGDTILVYTDGLTEAGENFPDSHVLMKNILEKTRQGQDYHRRIMKEALAISEASCFDDDVTILTANIK